MWRFVVVSLCYCMAFLSLVIFVLNPWVATITNDPAIRMLLALVFGVIAGTLGVYLGDKTMGVGD